MSYGLSSFASIPLSVLLAYVPHVMKIVLIFRSSEKGYNIKDPRFATENAIAKSPNGAQIRRCLNAHTNQLEMLPMFIGAILMGKYAGVPESTLSLAGIVYNALRVLYIYIYATNDTLGKASIRSFVWLACLSLVLGVMVSAVLKESSKSE
jgi:uncharacterized MAPEG superfamily protein